MNQLNHRKASARLQILNPDGSPAAGRSVRVDQVSHRFLFGCGAFDAVELMKTQDEPKQAFLRDRMEKWFGLFNYGTLPFYWGRYEPEEGQTAYTETMAAARWLREKGVTVKGHPLCWHTACAPWLMQYSNEEILRRQLERIRRDVSAFRGVIGLWDVINEVVIMPVFDKYDNAITRICKDLGRVGIVKEVFAAAKETDPDAVLLINDFNTSKAYEQLIEDLLEAGVPIGAIGIQSHQHQGYWGLEKLNDVLERYSRFGLPIHFTENTLISGSIMPAHIVDLNDWQVDEWPSTPEGEDRQAREIAEMYTVLFSHPLVEAITTWDFNDGCWLKAPSGFVHQDNSLKPSYEALRGLIHGEWETHETLVTDAEGYAAFTGFKGSYTVSSDAGSTGFVLENDLHKQLVLNL
ncbi:MAG: endo-1,4-beta-xylanase [Clostridiales bacterium]|uniref:Beta-xylanase n=1 Tax=uncultured bacterium Contig27 TaxID=1393547 RepID=W0FIJ5_9BACT|nr:family 10 endo-beta-1,4-xylanase [uncultured bacterium Contig27]MBR2660127.1 endo-1,4-beta-xylanase [Clostridia bacterium]MCR5565393.1 endo-1,4-beta-xylanase [Clostridiales bacterium]